MQKCVLAILLHIFSLKLDRLCVVWFEYNCDTKNHGNDDDDDVFAYSTCFFVLEGSIVVWMIFVFILDFSYR